MSTWYQPSSGHRSRLRWVVAGLIFCILLALLAVGAVVGWVLWTYDRASANTAGKVSFTNRLTVPPLAPSRLDERGRRVFDLTVQQGWTEFFPGNATRTWGVNGSYLGPTIRAARGEEVLLNVRNTLDEDTTLHWHGMHLPARMDGGPHQPIPAGGTWSPTWRIDQPAATLWYHPHQHGDTDRHVYRGVAGMFLVDDPKAAPAGLPATYGVDDIPLIVQDKRFGDDRQLAEGSPPLSPIGRLGKEILVNGVRRPYLDVTTERVRLRLVNASTARVYNIGSSDDRAFAVVGSDGGLLPRPETVRRVQLSPGERAEIVVTLRPGERTVLRSYPPDLGADFFNDRFGGGDDTLDLLELRAAATLRPAPALPATLAPAERLPESAAVEHRRFELSGRSINGRDMDLSRVDMTGVRDTVEVWDVRNGDGAPHNFHVHGVRFQVAGVDGRQPPPAWRGWKDTVLVRPDSTVRLVVRLPRHADPRTPYMFHCHLLKHEDEGMMGQFVVVERPGQQADSIPPPGHDPESHAGHGTPAR
jgi:blue copper oxidase